MCLIEDSINSIMTIGIIGFNENDIRELFKVYDINQSSELDCKNPTQNINENKNKIETPLNKEIQGDLSKKNYLEKDEIKEILNIIRNKLAARGVRGITSIARNFRIADDDNSQSLDYN